MGRKGQIQVPFIIGVLSIVILASRPYGNNLIPVHSKRHFLEKENVPLVHLQTAFFSHY